MVMVGCPRLFVCHGDGDGYGRHGIGSVCWDETEVGRWLWGFVRLYSREYFGVMGLSRAGGEGRQGCA
jgi:hypothetical protein